MAKLVKSEKISLKSHPEINESAIQEFIFNDPSVLGLGELQRMELQRIALYSAPKRNMFISASKEMMMLR